MEITSYFQLILLIGSALALVMAFFLWLNSSGLFQNKILGTMNFFWFIIVFVFALQSKDFYLKFPHLSRIVSIVPLTLFPLLFIYIKSYLSEERWHFWNFSIHFLPALAYLIAISPYYFQPAEVKRELIANNEIPAYIYAVGKVFDGVIILQGIFYSSASMRLIQHFHRSVGRRLTRSQRYILDWLKFFVLSYVFLWATGAVGAILEMLDISVPLDLFKVFYLGLTALTISIGIFSLRRPEILTRNIQGGNMSHADENEERTSPEEDLHELERILDYLEKEKAYLKNDLSLADLAEATGIPKHRISALLNNELGKNFYEVINEYRTREAIRLMNEGKHLNFTLTYIAEMAGFNSKATFNRIFKKITKQTPSEYIQSLYSRKEKRKTGGKEKDGET